MTALAAASPLSSKNNASGTSTVAATAASVVGNKKATLGQDDFMKLMVTQLKFQDPMKPMDNTEFIAQMAQFSSLQQMSDLNKTMAGQVDFNELSQASSLIGKQVSVNTDGQTFGGKVVEIRRVNNTLKAMIQKPPPPGPDAKPEDPVAVTIQEIQKVD
jgi:flagellar basal-body rod modification protein FlgD